MRARPHRALVPNAPAGRKRQRCSGCGSEDHNRRTCGAPHPVDQRRKHRSRRLGQATAAAPAPAGPEPLATFELEGRQAARLLRRLRPTMIPAAAQKRFAESLMLSCYLRGMLEADARWRARIEAWASGEDSVEELGAKILDVLGAPAVPA